jgi:hypothetical protein
MRRFRQVLNRLGCDSFEVYEQVGANWSNTQTSGRFVQIMRFRDRKHLLAVQGAERTDQAAQELIAEFCELVNYPYQQQQGQFAVGFYSSVLPISPVRAPRRPGDAPAAEGPELGSEFEADGAGFATAAAAGGALADSAQAHELLDTEIPEAFAGDEPEPLTEAEQEQAADEFAQAADDAGAPPEQPAQVEAASPEASVANAGQDVPAHEARETEEPALPTLDAESPLADVASIEEAVSAGPPAPTYAEPPAAQTPPPPPAEPDDFVLDDLDGGDDVELTDDDLARLAQELADEPRETHGGAGGPANPGSR